MARFPGAAKSRHEYSDPLCHRRAPGCYRRDDSGLGRGIPARRCGPRFDGAKRNPCRRWAVSIYEKPDLFWIAHGGFWIRSLVQPYRLDCADDSCAGVLLSPDLAGGKRAFAQTRRAIPGLSASRTQAGSINQALPSRVGSDTALARIIAGTDLLVGPCGGGDCLCLLFPSRFRDYRGPRLFCHLHRAEVRNEVFFSAGNGCITILIRPPFGLRPKTLVVPTPLSNRQAWRFA